MGGTLMRANEQARVVLLVDVADTSHSYTAGAQTVVVASKPCRRHAASLHASTCLLVASAASLAVYNTVLHKEAERRSMQAEGTEPGFADLVRRQWELKEQELADQRLRIK